MNKKRTLFWQIFSVIAAALIVAGGALLFRGRHYVWIALCLSVLACAAVFFTFERKNTASGEMTVLAVMVALSAMGRFVFAWLPGFKPVTAITVIAAVWLGSSSGFMVGSLAAFVSNFYFGQGPWTPWQMLGMGLCGFLAGPVFHRGGLPRKREALCAYGAVSAFLVYGILLNAYSALLATGALTWQSLAVYCASGFAMDAVQAISTVIFLWFFTEPMLDKLERVKIKYGFA